MHAVPRFLLISAFTLLTAISLSPSSQALETKRVAADYLQARLLSGVNNFKGTDSFNAGLEVRLDEHWHAYWRTPGDGGLPPQLDWTDSDNIEAIEIHYPAPTRFETAGLTSFGYTDRVLFPLSVTPADATKSVSLVLSANIMVCHEICVPQFIDLALTIPPSEEQETDAQTSRSAPILQRAIDTLPHKGPRPALKLKSVIAGPDALIVTAFSRRGYDNFDLFVETNDGPSLLAAPIITVDKEDPRTAMIRIEKPADIENLAPLLMNKKVTITAIDGDTAIEQSFSL